MRVHSPALSNTRYLPTKFATTGVRGGENVSIPVRWEDAPEGTMSFALSIIDHHPVAHNWVHWFVVNIPSSSRELSERASLDKKAMPAGSIELRNTSGEFGYGGPQPPKGSGPHEYVVTVFALSSGSLPLTSSSSLLDFDAATKGKVLASASVIGVFEQ